MSNLSIHIMKDDEWAIAVITEYCYQKRITRSEYLREIIVNLARGINQNENRKSIPSQ